jgi:predicted nucleotidyltransferase
VKILSIDKKIINDALKNYVAEIIKRYNEIEKIFLFGSYARDDYIPGNDVDLLIVLSSYNKKFIRDRIPDFIPDYFPIGIDIIPITKKELEEFLLEGNFFTNKF